MLPELNDLLDPSRGMTRETTNLLIKEIFRYKTQELQLKMAEVQKQVSDNEVKILESKQKLQDKAVKVAALLNDSIKSYVENGGADNKYSPIAIKSISNGFSSLLSASTREEVYEEEIPELNLTVFEDKPDSQKKQVARLKSSPVPLDQRIKTAQDQGMRWNDHNVMPTSERTVLRKLGDWEQGIELGSQADLNTATSREYDDLLKENSKPFMVGLCLSLEKSLDVKVPLSPYLKRRFNTLKEIYISRNGVTVGAEEVVEIPLDDQVEGLYNHIFKENRTEEHWHEVNGLLKRLFINRDEDIRKIPGEILCKVVSLGVYPPTLEWRSDHERERFERCSPGVLMPDQKEYYAPQLQKLRDEYIEMAGL
jgi:cell division protein FtsL